MAGTSLILPGNVRSVDMAERRKQQPSMTRRRKYGVPQGGASQRAVVQDDPVLGEIGTSGLRQYGGFVLEEWLPKLRGRYGAWAYRELIDNSPIIGGIMFAVRQLARQVEWRVEDDMEMSSRPDGLVLSCMHDMSHTWTDFVSEALSHCGYGWAAHEEVLKKCEGEEPPRLSDYLPLDEPYRGVSDTEEDIEEPAKSQYDDGLLTWRKLPIRAQETLMRWHFSGYSTLRGMEQIDWHGGRHNIGIGKMLLFRTETTRNNPEGRSLLRNAWTSFFALNNIQTIEAIGIERDLAGIPVLTPPDGVDLSQPAFQNLLEVAEDLVQGIRRDEDEGVVLPQAGWELSLLSTGGSRQIDTDAVIRRYEQRMTVALLSDWLILGQDSIGSYAMVDVKKDLFGLAVDAILDQMCDVMNRYAIPRLLKLNGLKPETKPMITHTSVGKVDLRTIGEFLTNLSLAGAPIPWTEPLMQHLWGGASLPKPNFDSDAQLVQAQPSPTARDSQWRPSWGDENQTGVVPPAPPVEREHISKTEDTLSLGPMLMARRGELALQLEREMEVALTELGRQVATGYATVSRKTKGAWQADRLAGSVMANARVGDWVRSRLLPLLRNHAGRVVEDTSRNLRGHVPVGALDEGAVKRVMLSAGRHLRQRDLEPQVRSAVSEAITAGGSPLEIADRIREFVPRGRFRLAGAKWRAGLVARTETNGLQREASLRAYQTIPGLTHVRASDGTVLPVTEGLEECPGLHPDDPRSYDPVLRV